MALTASKLSGRTAFTTERRVAVVSLTNSSIGQLNFWLGPS